MHKALNCPRLLSFWHSAGAYWQKEPKKCVKLFFYFFSARVVPRLFFHFSAGEAVLFVVSVTFL